MADDFSLSFISSAGTSTKTPVPSGSMQQQSSEKKHRIFHGVSRDDYLTAFAADKKRQKLEKGSKDGKRKETNAPALDRIPMPNLPESVKMEYRASVKDAQQRKVF
jgi:hypothetical protein